MSWKMFFELFANNMYGANNPHGFGCAWNTWGDKPLDWCIERVAEYGYDGVTINGYLLGLTGDKYKQTVKKAREALESNGLSCGVACHSWFINPREWEHKAAIEYFKKGIDWAVDLGADLVDSITGKFYDPPIFTLMTFDQAWKQAVDAWTEAAKYAEERGVDIAVEHTTGDFLTPDLVIKLIDEEVRSERLGHTIDTAHYTINQSHLYSMYDAIKKLGKRVRHVHLKDVTGHRGRINFCWYGGGIVNFDEFARALKDINYNHHVTVEWEAWIAGGLRGQGTPTGGNLHDFDLATVEAKKWLAKHGF